MAAAPLLLLLQIVQWRETGTMAVLDPNYVEPEKASKKGEGAGPAKASKQQEAAMKFM